MITVEYIVGAFMPYELDIITHTIPNDINYDVLNKDEKIKNHNSISAYIRRKTEQTTKKKNKPANEL